MAINYFTLLTKIGQASIANAIALGQKVNLTEMAIGDGNGNPTVPKESQTELVKEVYRAHVNQLMTDPDNPNYLIAEMIVPTNVGGWSVREVGLFDEAKNLIAIANFPETYKPKLEEGSGRDLVIRIILQVQSTDAVTLKIDPAVILASQAWVKENFTRAILLPGGTTGQILAKKSNANGDTEWKDIDIPEQANADWNATEGNAEILNNRQHWPVTESLMARAKLTYKIFVKTTSKLGESRQLTLLATSSTPRTSMTPFLSVQRREPHQRELDNHARLPIES